MACPPERYASLPVAPKYKEALIAFCSSPDNAGACERLCQASDEEIVATIEKMAPQLEQWEKNGVPDEIRNAHPDLANELPQQQSMDNGAVNQGIGGLPPAAPASVDPSIPPGRLADVPMPMDRPSSPNASTASYRNGGFVNAPSYGLGGLVDDLFGGDSGLLGGIIGGALAYFTGGMSLAAGAALGSAAGTFADTGDLGLAARAGLGMYGMGTAATGLIGAGAAASGTAAATQVGVPGSVAGASDMGAAAARGFTGTAAPAASSAANNFYKVAKVAGQLAQKEPEQPPMSLAPQAPTPIQNKDNGAIQIPGSGQYGGTANPQLSQGLGALARPTTQNAIPNSAASYTNITNTGDPEMEAYYQCVMENGAEACQMPDSMQNQQSPVNVQPAQYAQSFEQGGTVNGLGTETSDSQPAWLSDNEFVMTADAVRGLGNGNIDEGANRMYNMMAQLEQRGQS